MSEATNEQFKEAATRMAEKHRKSLEKLGQVDPVEPSPAPERALVAGAEYLSATVLRVAEGGRTVSEPGNISDIRKELLSVKRLAVAAIIITLGAVVALFAVGCDMLRWYVHQ